MSKCINPFSQERKKQLSFYCYEKIKENKIDFRIKNMTVMFTNEDQIDPILYNSLVLCDPNELLRLCSQKIN